MQNNLPDVIYAIPDCDQPVSEVWSKENVWTTSTTYIRQDSINVPELLEADGDYLIERVDSARVLHGARAYYLPDDIFALVAAAKELQRLKGLK